MSVVLPVFEQLHVHLRRGGAEEHILQVMVNTTCVLSLICDYSFSFSSSVYLGRLVLWITAHIEICY